MTFLETNEKINWILRGLLNFTVDGFDMWNDKFIFDLGILKEDHVNFGFLDMGSGKVIGYFCVSFEKIIDWLKDTESHHLEFMTEILNRRK